MQCGFDLAHYLAEGSDNSPPLKKNLVPRFRSLRKEGGVLGTEAVFSFPRGFFLGVVRPLNFQKLDLLSMSDTLCRIKNTDRVFPIRKVILEIKHFMIDFADGSLKQRLSWDTWNTSCTRERCGGSSSW